MSNLRLIKKSEITSAANLINITDCFSDDFQIYKITGVNIAMTNGGGDYLHSRLLNSSGIEITTNYDYVTGYIPSSGSSMTKELSSNDTEWESLSYIGAGTNDTGNITMYIFNPSNSLAYSFYISQASSFRTPSTVNYMFKSLGVNKNLGTVTGIQFSARTGNMDSGQFRIYGIRVDS